MVINIDEIINSQEVQRTNEIPLEYLNMKPQEIFDGWRPGMGPSELVLDPRLLLGDKSQS